MTALRKPSPNICQCKPYRPCAACEASPLARVKRANSPTAIDEFRQAVADYWRKREERCEWVISEDEQSGRFAA